MNDNSYWNFVAHLFYTAVDSPTPITEDDAAADLDNFRADGWDIPQGMIAADYANIWNELCDEMNADA